MREFCGVARSIIGNYGRKKSNQGTTYKNDSSSKIVDSSIAVGKHKQGHCEIKGENDHFVMKLPRMTQISEPYLTFIVN